MGEIYRSLYSVIPARVRDDHTLRPNAKLLYGELSALAQAEGIAGPGMPGWPRRLGSPSARWRTCSGSCGTGVTSKWRWSGTRTARRCCAANLDLRSAWGFGTPSP